MSGPAIAGKRSSGQQEFDLRAGPRDAVRTGSGDGELRDVSQPVAFDSQGRPLFAPRGVRLRVW